jgi:S-adenosylmethionine:tRNA ribosyltransferase-isomerase
LKHLSIDEFDYTLPESQIAQTPLSNRENSKLLHISKSKKQISHEKFSDLINKLTTNDVLVFNNTKVIKSRIICHRKTGAKIEVFFLNALPNNQWEAMIKKSGRLSLNETLIVDSDNQIQIIQKKQKKIIVKLISALEPYQFLEKYGQIPLPPYIKTSNPNQYEKSYQTTFASKPGAVAAPTAGLHFTDSILAQLNEKNIDIIYITLHVGLGTFNPIEKENIYEHKMHTEIYEINTESKNKLNSAIKAGKRLTAVGTTVARALESNISNNRFSSGTFNTNLFISPGYSFKAIHQLITNFHLPKSSLLILVCALATKPLILQAYHEAVENNYRFFSFGDAMLITE